MKSPILRFSLALACATTLAACAPFPEAAPTVPTGHAVGKNVLLSGRVAYPSAMRHLLAATSDVASLGTVTLLDGTTPVASGLTAENGDFTLYQATTPFTPEAGHCYTLEVSRRGPDADQQDLLSLRTVVKFVGDGWTSITGDTIVVSSTTTAIALAEAANEELAPADVIGMVDGDTVSPLDGLNANDVAARTYTVEWQLENNVDPVAAASNGEVLTQDTVEISNEASAARYRNVRVIDGDLNIAYAGNVRLLFPYLEKVTGTVSINYLPNAADLRGLGALREIRNLIVNGTMPQSLDGLQGLTHITNSVTLNGTRATVDGLDHLETIAGILQFNGAPTLTSIDGLGALKSVQRIDFYGLGHLTSLSGLASLASIQTLLISGAGELESLAGLERLSGPQPNLSITIEGASHLKSLAGLGAVTSMRALTLNGDGDETFTSLVGLPATLTTLERLRVSGCSHLTTLGAPQLTTITFSLFLSNNQSLTTVGLTGLTVIGLEGEDAPSLTLSTNGKGSEGTDPGLDCGALEALFELIPESLQGDVTPDTDIVCGDG